jgi:hypothetical protein
MKRLPLLTLLALVFAVVYACNDSTAPANSHALLAPKSPVVALEGEHPPPPVDAAIGVCVDGTTCAGFDGTYFASGSSFEAAVAAAELGDQSLGLGGTAWLRFDQGASASANARIQKTIDRVSGTGTLTVGTTVISFKDATNFTFFAHPCADTGGSCAEISFTTHDGHDVRMAAFSSEFCSFDPVEGETGCPFPFDEDVIL